jgi:polysaccharide export outer membrane protein
MHTRHLLSAVILGLALLGGVASNALAQEPAEAIPTSDYKVNPGDILQVSVWRESELQRDVLIRPDGKFSFPLAGDVDATNKSVDEIAQLLTTRLSKFIPDLVVSVSVLQINGNRIFVIGQVNRPGDFVVNPMVDVLQALSLAGGTTPFAQINDIKILRRTNGVQQAIEFRYRDIEKGKKLDRNILLQAGDVVVVP